MMIVRIPDSALPEDYKDRPYAFWSGVCEDFNDAGLISEKVLRLVLRDDSKLDQRMYRVGRWGTSSGLGKDPDALCRNTLEQYGSWEKILDKKLIPQTRPASSHLLAEVLHSLHDAKSVLSEIDEEMVVNTPFPRLPPDEYLKRLMNTLSGYYELSVHWSDMTNE
jgi:hypothetical protein